MERNRGYLNIENQAGLCPPDIRTCLLLLLNLGASAPSFQGNGSSGNDCMPVLFRGCVELSANLKNYE